MLWTSCTRCEKMPDKHKKGLSSFTVWKRRILERAKRSEPRILSCGHECGEFVVVWVDIDVPILGYRSGRKSTSDGGHRNPLTRAFDPSPCGTLTDSLSRSSPCLLRPYHGAPEHVFQVARRCGQTLCLDRHVRGLDDGRGR